MALGFDLFTKDVAQARSNVQQKGAAFQANLRALALPSLETHSSLLMPIAIGAGALGLGYLFLRRRRRR